MSRKIVISLLLVPIIMVATIGAQGTFVQKMNPLSESQSTLPLAKTWKKTFGGSGEDYGYRIEQTFDGGYIIIANLASSSKSAWILKLNREGNVEWQQNYGGVGFEILKDGHQTDDGGFIAIGGTDSYSGNPDIWLLKTNSTGSIEWSKYFDYSSDCYGWGVRQTTDGGFVLVGIIGESVWLAKTDSLGNERWNRTFMDGVGSYGYSVEQTRDGGFVIAGLRCAYPNLNDALLIKTDANGIEKWRKTYGGTGMDEALSVRELSDGFIIYGDSDSFHGSWLIRTDNQGNELWNRTYMGNAVGPVDVTTDGGFVFADSFYPTLRDTQMRIVKTDKDGNQEWVSLIGGWGEEWGLCVRQTDDGGYIATGITEDITTSGEDILVVKTNSQGQVHLGILDPWRHPLLSALWHLLKDLIGSENQDVPQGFPTHSSSING